MIFSEADPIDSELTSASETGRLGIMYLKRYWHKSLLKRNHVLNDKLADEWQLDKTLLSALGLGLEPTMIYLNRTSPTFEEFENWIEATSGAPDPAVISQFNAMISGDKLADADFFEPIFSDEELDFFEQNGYVILRNALSKNDCDESVAVICNFLGVSRYDQNTWYNSHNGRQGIMVQLFQHPVLNKNRRSERIRKAFEQLWRRKDIWVTTDRVGFNPPENESYQFPGPHLHWDVSLVTPIPFDLQGIIYLADTEAEQGAFTLVPGFQHKVEKWLQSLPVGVNPRKEDLHALGSIPIAAQAGDMVIWHQALPHGSRPNRSSRPRFVQYLTYSPADVESAKKWV